MLSKAQLPWVQNPDPLVQTGLCIITLTLARKGRRSLTLALTLTLTLAHKGWRSLTLTLALTLTLTLTLARKGRRSLTLALTLTLTLARKGRRSLALTLTLTLTLTLARKGRRSSFSDSVDQTVLAAKVAELKVEDRSHDTQAVYVAGSILGQDNGFDLTSASRFFAFVSLA